jgi:hypothetical protein
MLIKKKEWFKPEHGIRKSAHGMLDFQGRQDSHSRPLLILVEDHSWKIFQSPGVVFSLLTWYLKAVQCVQTPRTWRRL